MAKFLGWVFVASYTFDAALSIVSVLDSRAFLASSIFSTVMILFCVVVFVLSLLGTLLPRKVFVTLAGYYGLIVIFGAVAGTIFAISLQQRGDHASLSIGTEEIAKIFPWYPAAILSIVSVQLVIGIFGIVVLALANRSASEAHDAELL